MTESTDDLAARLNADRFDSIPPLQNFSRAPSEASTLFNRDGSEYAEKGGFEMGETRRRTTRTRVDGEVKSNTQPPAVQTISVPSGLMIGITGMRVVMTNWRIKGKDEKEQPSTSSSPISGPLVNALFGHDDESKRRVIDASIEDLGEPLSMGR